MKPIHKYLSTKINKPLKGIEIVYKIIQDCYNIDIMKNIESKEFIDDLFSEGKYEKNGFRIYTNDSNIMTHLNKEAFCKNNVFFNLMDSNIIDNICDDIIENYEYYGDDKNDIGIYHSDSFFAVENYTKVSGIIIVFEKLENGSTVNPALDTYYGERNRWIELSNRKLYLEINEQPKNTDRFYDVLDTMTYDAIKSFEEENEINISVLGRGGRHICISPSFDHIHRFEQLKEAVKIAQDNLVQDFNDEAEYEIDNEQ